MQLIDLDFRIEDTNPFRCVLKRFYMIGSSNIVVLMALTFVVLFGMFENFANASENLDTLLYYNDEYSFSVEYPEGWTIDDSGNFGENGVNFMDGSEESYLFEFFLWSTNISIGQSPDYGEKLSDIEERQIQMDFEKSYCDDSTYEIEQYTCKDFTVVDELPPSTSVDGYPVITTKYTMTKNYPEDFSSDIHMIGIISSIFVEDDVWDIRSESSVDAYDQHEKYIFHMINSFKLPASSTASQSISNTKESKEGGGCLITTAAYGTEMAPQVQFLREIRDNTVLSTSSGAAFMTGFNQLYYSFSPTIADMERENPMFQEVVRAFITPMISTLSIMTLAEGGSEAEVLGLGLSVIALNLGMYIAAPTLIGFKVHRHIKSKNV